MGEAWWVSCLVTSYNKQNSTQQNNVKVGQIREFYVFLLNELSLDHADLNYLKEVKMAKFKDVLLRPEYAHNMAV